MLNFVQIGLQVSERQFNEIVEDAVSTMKSLSPYPTGAIRGKGSKATGATKKSVAVLERARFEAFVGPTTPHAPYAEYGRTHWRPMQGWHFAEETAKILRAKYGGK